MAEKNALYGLMAQFNSPEAIVEATRRTYAAGYRRIDAYSPFPIEELDQALHLGPTRLPLLVLAGGAIGGLGAFFLQYYAQVISYPLNIGGRPLNSWPAYMPITFEVAILVAAFFGLLGMFALNRLPQPYHPVFNVPVFEMASRNQFFLVIEARDPKFQLEETRRFLVSLEPASVAEIEP